MMRTMTMVKGGFLLLLYHLVGATALPLLVKTKESFKLADLFYLEGRLQVPSCQRIIVDAATGSSLLWFPEDIPISTESSSCLQRCDWIGQVLVRSNSALDLVEQVRSKSASLVASEGWTLDYQRLTSDTKRRTEYSAKSLQTCVAQAIALPALLNTLQKATDQLLVVDTLDELFLVRLLQKTNDERPRIAWSSRPFQYSSSINPSVANIVIDILQGLVVASPQTTVRLLDPTCGSGTFLGVALTRGMAVEGWDINLACVEGARKNLEYFFPEQPHRWSIEERDASLTQSLDHVDCLVANLPWGQNTIAQYPNAKILEQFKTNLRPQTPCAFITKDDDSLELRRLGYTILGQTHVPPKGFVLPKSKKKSMSGTDSSVNKGTSSDCVITVALSP